MAEYALITATLALLAIGVGSLPAGEAAARLPTTTAKARLLVDRVARAQGVSAAGARAALRRGPYRSVVLRYLYATGWIGGSKSPGQCQFTRLTQDTTRKQAAAVIRDDGRVLESLRAARVRVETGADAVTRGIVSACGG